MSKTRWGMCAIALFYLICGVAAALTLAFMDPSSSHSDGGRVGRDLRRARRLRVSSIPARACTVIVPLGIIFYPMKIGAIWVVGFWFVLQLLSAAFSDPSQPGVAFWAHVGGFIVGGLLTPLFKSAHIPLFGDVHRGPWG